MANLTLHWMSGGRKTFLKSYCVTFGATLPRTLNDLILTSLRLKSVTLDALHDPRSRSWFTLRAREWPGTGVIGSRLRSLLLGHTLYSNWKETIPHKLKPRIKKMTCMTFQCMIALRNKTVAHTFLPSFDNANDRLCQQWSRKIDEVQKSCCHGNLMSHFSSL